MPGATPAAASGATPAAIAPPTLLRVEALTAAYGEVTALRGVDLRVDEAEIVCVLGANGAGKTTLLRAISGLLPPAGGSIRLGERELGAMAAEDIVRAGVVHVPQGRMVFASLSVRENLVMGGFTRPGGEAAAGIERAVSYFPRLGERMRQRAGTLSGGEQQMLAIARGLMSSPRLLMLDEPSMGVAPVIKDLIFDKLAEIRTAERMSMLLVEQDADYALSVSDRGYVLEAGAIALDGPASTLASDDKLKKAYLGG
ncbi:MAG: ABC transporter ATP-binding protein [Lautropia sp.]